MRPLFIIPARGGSKGIPHKNIKKLNGKPLICYAIDVARKCTSDENICVSTDDDEIIDVVNNYGLNVPFKRPAELATDNAGTYEVLLHAIRHYEGKGEIYDTIVLLQTTSPFRQKDDVVKCLELYKKGMYQMVVSVKEARCNPYYNCFEPDDNGFLRHSKGDGSISRRQDAPKAYEYNGAVYVMDIPSLLKESYSKFNRIGFCVMDEFHSLDLDTPLDWKMAEIMLQNYLV